ncbi:hypothetical protein Tco_0423821, partial [Tanacetum coccineum]
LGREAKWDFNDKHRLVNVVNGKHKGKEWDNRYKKEDATNQKNSKANEMHMSDPEWGRVIDIKEKDGNDKLMGMSVVAEVVGI